MNTFHDELIKLNKGNANNFPDNQGNQATISSMPPPKFKPEANNKFGKDSDAYKNTKSGGALLGYANIVSSLKLLKDSKIGSAAPGLNLLTGSYDALNEDNSTPDRIAGGARGASGLTGILGLLGAIPKAGALAGATAGKGAFAAGGAFASGASALASGGAVLGAGAAGYGVGKLMNKVSSGLTSATGIGGYIDDAKGVKRQEGESDGYSISDLAAEGLTALDKWQAGEEKDGSLDYKDMLGYKLVNYFNL